MHKVRCTCDLIHPHRWMFTIFHILMKSLNIYNVGYDICSNIGKKHINCTEGKGKVPFHRILECCLAGIASGRWYSFKLLVLMQAYLWQNASYCVIFFTTRALTLPSNCPAADEIRNQTKKSLMTYDV